MYTVPRTDVSLWVLHSPFMALYGIGGVVGVGGTGVAVGGRGTGVAVGGLGVAVGGTGVFVGLIGVTVGGTAVGVLVRAGVDVLVGGAGVAVKVGLGVLVGVGVGSAWGPQPATSRLPTNSDPATAAAMKTEVVLVTISSSRA